MQQLQKLADRRAQDERVLAAALSSSLTEAENDFEETGRRLAEEHAQRRRTLESEFAAAREAAVAAFEAGMSEAHTRRQAAIRAATGRRESVVVGVEHHAKESEWQTQTVYEAQKNKPFQLVEESALRLQARRRQLEGLERDARTILEMRSLVKAAEANDWRAAESTDGAEADGAAPPATPEPTAGAEERLHATLQELHQNILEMEGQRLPTLFNEGGRHWVWFGAVVLLATPITAAVMNFTVTGWIVGAVVGLVLGAALLAVFVPRGKRATLTQYALIQRQLEEARLLERASTTEARAASDRLAQEILGRRDRDLAAIRKRRDQEVAAVHAQFDAEFTPIEPEFEKQSAALASQRDRTFTAADAKYPPLLEENQAAHVRGDHENAQRFDARRAEAHEKHDAAWGEMAETWLTGFREISGELAAMQARCTELFPNWADDSWRDWRRPAMPPEAVLFGQCPLPLQLVKNAVPEDKRLDPGVRRLVLPAAMCLAEQPRLAITADGAGRKAAVEVLQLAMLRFLVSMPAGKVRLTIIDPSGLGENFSAFMHLADYDEQLVAGRIWTDSKHIDERLSLISKHMEKVLQKYLRNEFATLHDYNQTAGEVAEPYHLVVAANFPAGFSDSAARKLVSIASAGPRCGVYTLVSIDRSLRLPHEFKLDELLNHAVHLDWVEDRLVWKYPLFEKLPLEIDNMPPAERLSEVLHRAGEESRAASRVEVPFALVAPAEGKTWTADSGRELVVPIGRAGAKELQCVRLGLGTSQHVLVAGKTGSGKSTLLHALITNLALHYGPDQVEFYLVDFKKGVEFKGYATGRLPHARVIAIESEREFGVSVLERLDQELRRRGELFRTAGVQDLAGFRRASPHVPMPRTLLIIDEFQELFVADDKLAADAALLLDRLVRQGRAFGIHVLLGSQTLSGAYSLARSTLGQMAVRVALECSESDAHLILSDENTAARLLTRPGEAIYNDQNGLLVGNHPFQVVWLPDAERQKYLASLRESDGEAASAAGRPAMRLPTADPTIVFEGNVPADPRDNPEFVDAIAHPEHTTHQEPTIWLGSAVRIEPSTRIALRRQGGHNLVVVGGQESLAVGMLTSAVVALAAQHGAAGARFTILDGTRPESIEQGVWSQVAATVGESVDVVPPRNAGAAVVALADEVVRRSQSPEERFASIYLVVHDLAQFRDLRLTDDDFSFSFSASNGKPPSPDKRFREILKEGPAVGVHVLLWCESYNSLTRVVDRLSMREIEFRVATQMSAADSTNLIDSPAATLLGEHRAILYRDDLGTQTKFRPYGRLADDWLAWAAGHFRKEVAVKAADAAGGLATD